MPRRDASYMEEQRRMIANAARRCILEKGWAATSMRDVCNFACISKGALYVHFKTREELFVAVGELDDWLPLDPVDNWADYEARVAASIDQTVSTDFHRKMMSASYEFLGEIIRGDLALPKVHERCDAAYAFFRESLRAMHARSQISLPLGLDHTVRLHAQIQSGAIYSMLLDERQDRTRLTQEVGQSLAHTAGLTDSARTGAATLKAARKPLRDQAGHLDGAMIALPFLRGDMVGPTPSIDGAAASVGRQSEPAEDQGPIPGTGICE